MMKALKASKENQFFNNSYNVSWKLLKWFKSIEQRITISCTNSYCLFDLKADSLVILYI